MNLKVGVLVKGCIMLGLDLLLDQSVLEETEDRHRIALRVVAILR